MMDILIDDRTFYRMGAAMIVDVEAFDKAGSEDCVICKCDFCGVGVWKIKSNIKTSRKKTPFDCCANGHCKQILRIRKGNIKSLYDMFPHIAAQLCEYNPETGERQPDARDIPCGSNQKLWWDAGCGHGAFEQTVFNRTARKQGCPKCGDIKSAKSRSVTSAQNGNSLFDNFPELAAQLCKFNPITGEKQPDPKDVPCASNQKLWWDAGCGHGPFDQYVRNRTSEQKNGCPSCAEYGFNPNQKAIVYLIEKPDKMKIGITNLKTETIEENARIKRHQCNGWSLIDHIVFETGQDAYNLEQAILTHLDTHNISRGYSAFLEPFNGITESWRIVDYAPRTIMEITTTIP